MESKSTLEITQFVYLGAIPIMMYEKSYFIVPEPDKQTLAYTVIQRALAQTGKTALGEIAFGGRELLIVIAPASGKSPHGLMGYTLHYEQELRDAAQFFPSIESSEVDKKQLAMAVELIRQYSSELDLSAFKDDYEAALRQLIDAKAKNMPLPLEPDKPKQAKVIDLAGALRRSLGKSATAEPSAGGRKDVKKEINPVKSGRHGHQAA